MLIKNTFYNLIGLGVPLLAAMISIPMLIEALGDHRFGLLTLIWAVVSYFGFFDMGLGRAMTQQLSMLFAQKSNERIAPLVLTASLLIAGLGVFAGLCMAILAPWGVGLIKGVPDQQEAIDAVYIMAFALPFIVLTAGFRGILEAKHAFFVLNLIRLPMGVFTFLGPLAVVMYGQTRLDWIAFILVAGRILAFMLYAWYAWRILPVDRGPMEIQKKLIGTLFISGGWMTVSNIISPFMGYVDRFLIGTLISASAVAFYVTPQELVTKLSIFPGALTAVLFPIFAAKIEFRDSQVWFLLKTSVYSLFLVLLPLTVAIAIFADELLTIWINSDFADHSSIYMQIFAVGMLFNSLAQISFVLIQSAGASQLTAKVHIIELPLFLVALWLLIPIYGILGAAIAWFVRIVFDTLLMFNISSRLLGQPAKDLLSYKFMCLGILAAVGFSGILIQPIIVRIFLIILIFIISAFMLMNPWKRLHTYFA